VEQKAWFQNKHRLKDYAGGTFLGHTKKEQTKKQKEKQQRK